MKARLTPQPSYTTISLIYTAILDCLQTILSACLISLTFSRSTLINKSRPLVKDAVPPCSNWQKKGIRMSAKHVCARSIWRRGLSCACLSCAHHLITHTCSPWCPHSNLNGKSSLGQGFYFAAETIMIQDGGRFGYVSLRIRSIRPCWRNRSHDLRIFFPLP